MEASVTVVSSRIVFAYLFLKCVLDNYTFLLASIVKIMYVNLIHLQHVWYILFVGRKIQHSSELVVVQYDAGHISSPRCNTLTCTLVQASGSHSSPAMF